MDSILESQLERMEKALNTLLSSVITYNPSVTAADELLQADDELTKGLEQLELHQSNYTRLLHLRHESELLDSQIKSSVQLLADLRKDLLAVPLEVVPSTAATGEEAAASGRKPVEYKTLLAYAKNISPFTIPPTFRPKPATTTTTTATVDNEKSKDENGQGTAAATAVTAPGDDNAIATTPQIAGEEASTDNHDPNMPKSLTEEHKAWISDLQKLPFQPWPGEVEMSQGALRVLHHQVENGNDPTDLSKVLEEERYLAERRRVEEEEERRRKEARERAVASANAARPAGAGSGARLQQGAGGSGSGARFGLDDEDSDED